MNEFTKERRTFIVCGGGIAGLSAALYISRCGYRVDVLEKAPALDTHGAGIQLSPNAMRVIDDLGLKRHVTMAALAPENIRVLNAKTNRRIVDIPLGNYIVEKYNQPYLAIHRGDLLKILHAACEADPDIEIRFGVKVHDAQIHANGISVLGDNNGATGYFRGIAIIGADGVHSNIRKACIDTRPAVYSGSCAIRGLIPVVGENQNDNISPNTTIALGADAHAVTYPVQTYKNLNVVLIIPQKEDEHRETIKIDQRWLDDKLANWSPDFTQTLRSDIKWTKWPLYNAPKLKFWTRNSIALVGDAAHAMMPYAAQGAAMALEDAAQLGFNLSTEPDIPKAFKTYQKFRRRRINKVRALSNSNHQLYHMGNLFIPFRNIAMKIMGGKLLLRRQHWVYQWQVPKLAGKITTRSHDNNELPKYDS